MIRIGQTEKNHRHMLLAATSILTYSSKYFVLIISVSKYKKLKCILIIFIRINSCGDYDMTTNSSCSVKCDLLGFDAM
jgi:hypothetical protein